MAQPNFTLEQEFFVGLFSKGRQIKLKSLKNYKSGLWPLTLEP